MPTSIPTQVQVSSFGRGLRVASWKPSIEHCARTMRRLAGKESFRGPCGQIFLGPVPPPSITTFIPVRWVPSPRRDSSDPPDVRGTSASFPTLGGRVGPAPQVGPKNKVRVRCMLRLASPRASGFWRLLALAAKSSAYGGCIRLHAGNARSPGNSLGISPAYAPTQLSAKLAGI